MPPSAHRRVTCHASLLPKPIIKASSGTIGVGVTYALCALANSIAPSSFNVRETRPSSPLTYSRSLRRLTSPVYPAARCSPGPRGGAALRVSGLGLGPLRRGVAHSGVGAAHLLAWCKPGCPRKEEPCPAPRTLLPTLTVAIMLMASNGRSARRRHLSHAEQQT